MKNRTRLVLTAGAIVVASVAYISAPLVAVAGGPKNLSGPSTLLAGPRNL